MKFIRLNEHLIVEKYDTRLAKVLGNAIIQTSNPSGQGAIYKDEINFIKANSNLFKSANKNAIIIAHHKNGNHSDNRDENIEFLLFKDHSTYFTQLVSIADELIEYGRFDYDELDFLARIKQINTLIDKCNKKHSSSFGDIELIDIDTTYIDYVKKLFSMDEVVQSSIEKLSVMSSVDRISLLEVKNLMKKGNTK